MSKTIASLDIQIQACAGSASTNIDRLAASLGRLSNALTTLKCLPETMKSIDTATLDGFAEGMKKPADALEPLSTRIDKVTAGFSRLIFLPINIRYSIATYFFRR